MSCKGSYHFKGHCTVIDFLYWTRSQLIYNPRSGWTVTLNFQLVKLSKINVYMYMWCKLVNILILVNQPLSVTYFLDIVWLILKPYYYTFISWIIAAYLQRYFPFFRASWKSSFGNGSPTTASSQSLASFSSTGSCLASFYTRERQACRLELH